MRKMEDAGLVNVLDRDTSDPSYELTEEGSKLLLSLGSKHGTFAIDYLQAEPGTAGPLFLLELLRHDSTCPGCFEDIHEAR